MSERAALRHATARFRMIDSTAVSHGAMLVRQKVVVVHYYKVPTSIHPSYPTLPVLTMSQT